MSRTCIQRVIAERGPRKGQWIVARRPHVVPESTADGYAQCEECGASVYVGQGYLSPQAGQHREYLAALADRRG